MAEIIEAPANWKPPEDADWVSVRVSKSGHAELAGSAVLPGNSAVFLAVNNGADIANAVDRAVEWAGRHGIATVHIQRNLECD